MNFQKPRDKEEGLATQGSDDRSFCQDPQEAEATFPLLFLFLGRHGPRPTLAGRRGGKGYTIKRNDLTGMLAL